MFKSGKNKGKQIPKLNLQSASINLLFLSFHNGPVDQNAQALF